jgi:hypothetical protein
MNQDRSHQRVISPVAYFISSAVFVVGFAVMRYAAIPSDPKSVEWPEFGKVLLSTFVPLIGSAWVLLIGYIYGDARRRHMRYIMWTLLAIFIPDAIGIILYFVLRDPLPAKCPGCGASVMQSYTFCPACSTPLRPTCTQCGRPMERGWKHCPNCGAAAPVANQLPPAGAQPTPVPIGS